jgi:5-methylcytosine-specific restriction endonuclease McrBC regulatory subunit McrC
LKRLYAILEQLNRTFTYAEVKLSAPKGRVNWNKYASRQIPSVKFLEIPCIFPDLKENEELMSAIHFTLKILLGSLESQRTSGIYVLQLIELCQSLLSKVNTTTPKQPSVLTFQRWTNLPIKTDIFKQGLQAIEWIVEDRGLAGISTLNGLPWIMQMEIFFEAWIETFAHLLIRRTGGHLKTGRKRETITPISWEPSFMGSQKFLLPDVIIERDNDIIILDAKYKRHWEELSFNSWSDIENEVKEKHREDLLQILAYSTATDKKNITSCLIYPCKESTWESMLLRGRTIHKASLYAGNRKINILLTAIPMKPDLTKAIDLMSYNLRN